MKHKKLFTALTAVISVIVFLGVFLFVWFVGDTYPDFKDFKKQAEIPGLADGAIPQGMTTVEVAAIKNGENSVADKQVYYFISAYMKDGSPSRIYVTGEKRGYVGYVTMTTENDKAFYGHCGGIAINNTMSTISTTSSAKSYTLWVTGESKVYVAKASEEYATNKKAIAQEIVEKAAENGNIKFTNSFNANCNASFCYYYKDPRYPSISSDRLYVGEFYRPGNYKTAENHVVTTPSGYVNHAFMYEYNVSTNDAYGLTRINEQNSDANITAENNVPKIQKIFSLPEKIQGVAWTGRKTYGSSEGALVLSQSYGLANSHLLCFNYASVISTSNRKYYRELPDGKDGVYGSFRYEGVYKTVGGQKIDYTDKSLYVYYVDMGKEEMLLKDYSIPSMSEGLCNLAPLPTTTNTEAAPVYEVYVLFESAGKKYSTFTRDRTKNIYSINLKDLNG